MHAHFAATAITTAITDTLDGVLFAVCFVQLWTMVS